MILLQTLIVLLVCIELVNLIFVVYLPVLDNGFRTDL